MASPLKNLLISLHKKEILLPKLRSFLVAELKEIEEGRKKRSGIEKENLRMTIKCAEEKIEEFNHGDLSDDEYFHPSQIGVCLRQLWFARLGAPRDGSKMGTELLTSTIVFDIGSAIHVIFQNLCERAGVLASREIAIVDAKRKIMGHADGIVKIDGQKHILEIKSINSRGFNSLSGPKPEHVAQATLYMKCLGIKSVIFVYIEKDRHAMKEFFVELDVPHYFKLKERIKTFFTHIKKKTMPPAEGKHPQQFPCSFCDFRKTCFDTRYQKAFLDKLKKK